MPDAFVGLLLLISFSHTKEACYGFSCQNFVALFKEYRVSEFEGLGNCQARFGQITLLHIMQVSTGVWFVPERNQNLTNNISAAQIFQLIYKYHFLTREVIFGADPSDSRNSFNSNYPVTKKKKWISPVNFCRIRA